MTRFRTTLTLAAAAIAALATAAAADPAPPDTAPAGGDDMAAMHAQMPDASDMPVAMHAQVPGDGMAAMHAQMSSTPAMREHMATFGIDPDEMADWMEQGRDRRAMHAELAARGIDVAGMSATCPMAGPGPTMPDPGTMADDAGHERHHP
jgi:hypothetical protein